MNTIYFHSRHANCRVTVAGIIEGQRVKFGVSRCSKRDHFNKRTGRSIATGRAAKNPYAISTIPPENFSKWFVENATEIANQVHANPEFKSLAAHNEEALSKSLWVGQNIILV